MSIQSHPAGAELLTLSAPGAHELIDPLRDLALVVVQGRLTSVAAQHVGLATHELVENAVLYGTMGWLDYSLTLDEAQRGLHIRVSNNAVAGRISALKSAVEKLANGGGKRSLDEGLRAATRGGLGRSQLGLARVAHEASMDVAFSVNGSRVTILASYKL